MMKRKLFFLYMLAFWFVFLETAWGFLPPVDQQNGVKLSIDGVPETVNLKEGVIFKVVAENETEQAVTVTLSVWMNDDWQVSPETPPPFELAAKERREIEYKGKASERALEAWYPVHAKGVVVNAEGKSFELHPIALFKTEKAMKEVVEAPVTGGDDQTAWFATKGVQVDGDLTEWWGQAIPVSCGAERVSTGKLTADSFDGVVMFLHDKQNIYVAGQIADDDISCDDKISDDFMNSDYLRFYFHGVEPSSRKDTAFTKADKIIAVNVFGDADDKPLLKIPPYANAGGDDKPPADFHIVTRRTAVGYVFEASLPKAVIGAAEAKAIGMNLMIGDADKKARRTEVHFGRGVSSYWLTPDGYFRLNLAGPRGERLVEDYKPETIVMGRTDIRLDHAISRRVAYRTVDAEAETVMARGFDGSDIKSGMVFKRSKSIDRRNDVREGLVFHPPFKNGAGYVKVTYRIQLSEKYEAMLVFATALRDHHDGEAPSDGVEYIVEIYDGVKIHRLFRRVSTTKTWEPTELDLRNFKGQTIELSLIVTPGEKNDTSCDECYWAQPRIALKTRLGEEPKTQLMDRRQASISMAQQGLLGRTGRGKYRLQKWNSFVYGTQYQLKSADGTVYGVGLVPGPEGLSDCFLTFTDGHETLIYEGFTIDVGGVSYGLSHGGEPIVWKGLDRKYGRDIFRHQIETPRHGTVPLEIRVFAYGGTLQFTFVMPDVERDLRGHPRYTKLALGKGNETPWRIYGGFGNVIEGPKDDFVLNRGGFTLNTRHVGVDYRNGLSMAIASDFFPDRMVCKPSENLFTLEAHNDVTFYFAPSSINAFMAAKEYGRVAGFKPSPGLDELLGRQCLDQWGGEYQTAAEGAKMAAKYGLFHSVFVKHVWQRWGYDYRLPEIYPPMGGLEPFRQLSDACQENGIIFAPHDNYIDFYPDAEGFSYNHIIFNENGTPQKAWYNRGRQAQSYRWLPHAFKPWLVKNMELIRDNIGAHGLFIDVFSAIPPMDYYDREGRFFNSKRTAKEWSDAFDTCREILWKDKAVMLSECGHDGLIGSLDGGQADHYSANRWGANTEWERVPWHDIVSHGKFVLLGGGLGSRYAEKDPAPSGYGSDNYNSTTVIGGRNPMSDGPFSINAVKTYWMLHDVCDWLARHKFHAFEFGKNDINEKDELVETLLEKRINTSIHRLHAVFGDELGIGEVWCNRSSKAWILPPELWQKEPKRNADEPGANELDNEEIDDEQVTDMEMDEESLGPILPAFGYYVKTPSMTAYVVIKDGRPVGFSRKDGCVFYDARPPYTSILSKKNITATVKDFRKLSELVYELDVEWNFEVPSTAEKASQFVHVTHPSSNQGESILYYGNVTKTDVNHRKAGVYHSTIKVQLPENAPEGEHTILFGIFNPQNGSRLGITSIRMEGTRVFGGAIRVTRNDGKAVTEIVETATDGSVKTLDLPMVNFDGVKTNGSFRWVRLATRRWQLIPVPGSLPFRVEANQKDLVGLTDARMVSVKVVDPWNDQAKEPKTVFLDGVLKLEVDARSFAYIVDFE